MGKEDWGIYVGEIQQFSSKNIALGLYYQATPVMTKKV